MNPQTPSNSSIGPVTVFNRDDCEMDWIWLAVDAVGQIGLFSSFGDGELLPSLRESIERAEMVEAYIFDRLDEEQSGFCDGSLDKANCDALLTGMMRRGKTPSEVRAEYESVLLTWASCGLFVYHPQA